ncbi:hypothetical protein [Euzebya tangerina]|uniref:hypothetical protein n=1 Tax=Euzebya tangerina TaxID=591198 RepID=UPI0013C2D5F5|nr:hypothetical protein [Euzebya tangerina]
MTSEAAIERHIEAGEASRATDHDAAPEEYVSYQDLAVEIDLDEPEQAADSTLPRTAPAGFSIALPSAASRDIPVTIGRSEDDPVSASPEPEHEGFDFFVGGAAPAAQALTEPLDGLAETPDRAPTEVSHTAADPAPQPTAEDTAQLPQGEILAFEDPAARTTDIAPDITPQDAADEPLPVLEPAPELPGEGSLHLPDRLRNPLPPPQDAELAAAGDGSTTANQPTDIDLTAEPEGVDVTDLIDAESDEDLDIVDDIPDVSEQVTIDPELAVLDGVEAAGDQDPAGGGPAEHAAAPRAPVRLFTRKDAGGIPSAAAAVDDDRTVMADLDPTADSVLGEHDRPAAPVDVSETPEPVEEVEEPDAGLLHGAEEGAMTPGAGWSTSAVEDDRHWNQMLEPRRTWLDRIAAVIFVLCLIGAAVFLALNI